MTTKIGEAIKKKRLVGGLTQAELAEGICTQATISNLESKGSLPTTSILLKITDKLNMKVLVQTDRKYLVRQTNKQ